MRHLLALYKKDLKSIAGIGTAIVLLMTCSAMLSIVHAAVLGHYRQAQADVSSLRMSPLIRFLDGFRYILDARCFILAAVFVMMFILERRTRSGYSALSLPVYRFNFMASKLAAIFTVALLIEIIMVSLFHRMCM